MSFKTWMVHKMSRPFVRTDLPPRRAPRSPCGISSAPREPILREVEGLGAVPTTLEHLGPYGTLIGTGTQIRSRSVNRMPCASSFPLFTWLRWVSITPFGCPVVPDVY